MSTNSQLLDPDNKITQCLDILKSGNQDDIEACAREMALRQDETRFFVEALRIYLHQNFVCIHKPNFISSVAGAQELVESVAKELETIAAKPNYQLEQNQTLSGYFIHLKHVDTGFIFSVGLKRQGHQDEQITAIPCQQLSPASSPFMAYVLLQLAIQKVGIKLVEIKYFQ